MSSDILLTAFDSENKTTLLNHYGSVTAEYLITMAISFILRLYSRILEPKEAQ